MPTSPKSPQFNAIYDHRFDSPHPFRIHCSNFHFVLLLWVVEFTSMLPPALSPLLILFPSLFSSPTFLPTLYRLLSSPLLKIRKLFLLGFLVKSFFLVFAIVMRHACLHVWYMYALGVWNVVYVDSVAFLFLALECSNLQRFFWRDKRLLS